MSRRTKPPFPPCLLHSIAQGAGVIITPTVEIIKRHICNFSFAIIPHLNVTMKLKRYSELEKYQVVSPILWNFSEVPALSKLHGDFLSGYKNTQDGVQQEAFCHSVSNQANLDFTACIMTCLYICLCTAAPFKDQNLKCFDDCIFSIARGPHEGLQSCSVSPCFLINNARIDLKIPV